MPKFNRQRRSGKGNDNNKGGSNWLQTYGDMITLLLAFFVLLYSISTVDAEKFERMLVSLHESFSGVLPEHRAQIPREDPNITLPEPSERQVPSEEEQMMEDIYDQLEDYIEDADLAEVVMLETEERGIVIRFQDKILFDSGRAELRSESLEILGDIAEILEEIPNEIKVEGFTDDVPIDTPEFPSNWELSAARATTVLRYLSEEGGLDPGRLQATGYGEYRPMVPNDSPENRQLNRRVDITVLWSVWEQDDYYDRDTTDLFERGEDEIE
ncbi:flagellar motor protein MotB [Natranaerobius thermophilus]|uniref:OmpA/MotB domain protein n=1 Tax=Natranaerobius thermophilus (strain ATCC BAA-1301 / DSM 18059 / JW/NM-WN-LF) TaxID=457570 RepID=B2A356_NATTJ|nr:flagellar motor protein MotB [Natranaerobius thermophilus]ACB84986.1 OmpA/MotB domain protein [Natranaerobius thermophilus JW/NM-WN-LF]